MADTLFIRDSINLYQISFNLPSPSNSGITFINIVIALIGIVITFYINFVAFAKRRENERTYQSKLNFYNELVLSRINEIMNHVFRLDSIIREILAQTNSIRFVAIIQAKSDEIENIQDKFEKETLIYLQCYSDKLKVDVDVLTENFLNSILEIISNSRDISDDYKSVRVLYISNVFQAISDSKPVPSEKEMGFFKKIYESIKSFEPPLF